MRTIRRRAVIVGVCAPAVSVLLGYELSSLLTAIQDALAARAALGVGGTALATGPVNPGN